VIRVAIVQGDAGRDATLTRTAELAAEAAQGGATIVVFPETWLPGYPIWLDVCRDVAIWDSPAVKKVFADYASRSIDVNGADGAALSRIAADLNITLVIGVSERVAAGPGRGTLYNSLLTYGSDGTLLNHHRKLMPTYTERIVWGAGDATGVRAVDIEGGCRIGGLICWEHWMPLTRQALHESGEDIHVAVWPTAHDMLQVASRHYAFEGRCFVLAAGSIMRGRDLPAELEPHPSKVPSPDAFIMRGGSAIYGPNGALIAGPIFDDPMIVFGDLDLQRVREESMALDVAGHYSRPDCFSFGVTTVPRRETK
jgi:predicted amidohydrolase